MTVRYGSRSIMSIARADCKCSRYAQAGQLIRYGNIWALNRGIEAKKPLFKTIDFEPEIEENNLIVIQSLELNRLERGGAARSRGKI